MKQTKAFAAIILMSFAGIACAESELIVKIDGKPLKFEGTQPQTFKGRILVPMRGIFEAIGAYVEYDPVAHKVTATRNNEDVELTMGRKIATKNGAEILLDISPMVLKDTTMVPLRFIAESLGAKVDYDKANNQVNIRTEPAPTGS